MPSLRIKLRGLKYGGKAKTQGSLCPLAPWLLLPCLEQVKEYKYLAVMLSENSIFKSNPKVLANQANKALSNLSYPRPSLICYLFDLLVSPIMNYASETWDCTVSDYNRNSSL